MRKGIVLTLSVVLLLAASGFGYYQQIYLPAQVLPVPAYSTTKVRTGDISITAAGVGNIQPSEKVSVGFHVSGTLTQLAVKVGDPVEVGQVLARLDDSDAQLRFRQAELSYNSYFSPDTLHQAEIAQLNAKADLKDAILRLEYLISPPVYYWETELEQAGTELARLKAQPQTSESDLQLAQQAYEKAERYLNSAKYEYYASYVWAVFPYSYVNDAEETIETYIEPTPDEINLARLEVKTTELALLDAEEYLLALQNKGEGEKEGAVFLSTSLTKLEQAWLDLETARAAIDHTILTAPVSGTVTSMTANPGQVIGTTPFLTIETLDRMALRFYVEESDLHLIQNGSPVIVTFEAYPEVPVEGQITSIEPAMQTIDGTNVAVIWASLPENIAFQLLSGMTAEVEVIAGQSSNALLVPVQALRELAPGSYAVFVVQDDESLKMTPVTVGLKDYANAEILSGLSAGDVVSTGTVETK
jgi:HlyD family secretion protein